MGIRNWLRGSERDSGPEPGTIILDDDESGTMPTTKEDISNMCLGRTAWSDLGWAIAHRARPTAGETYTEDAQPATAGVDPAMASQPESAQTPSQEDGAQ